MAVRLNVGSGSKRIEGYLSCDFADNYSGNPPDVVCDVRKLPFDADSVDEILAVHILEHLYVWEAEATILEWKRVLKPGGKLIIEVPCLDKIINRFIKFEGAPPINLGMWGLYGDPSYKDERMTHRWCYSSNQLRALLDQCKMSDITEEEPKYHVAIRDMRFEATK